MVGKTSRKRHGRQWHSRRRRKIREQDSGGDVWGKVEESVASGCLWVESKCRAGGSLFRNLEAMRSH